MKKNDDMKETKQAVIEGVLEWAHLQPGKPNELSGKYQVDVCQLPAATVKELKGLGLEVQDGAKKGKPDKGFYVTPKATKAVAIVDSKKTKFEDAERIGNGTKAKVAIRAFPYNFKGKEGIGCGLQAIQILDLNEYSPAGMFAEEEGFVAEPTQTAFAIDPFEGDDVPK